MNIPTFYTCLNCKDVFEVIGGEIRCPECKSLDAKILEGEDQLKCRLRNRDLLILQKFHEVTKYKNCLIELNSWINEILPLIPDEKKKMVLLYKLHDMVTDNKGNPHGWNWKEGNPNA